MSDQDKLRVSGAVVIDQMRACEQIVGSDIVSEVMQAQPIHIRQSFDTLMPVSWIEVEKVEAVLRQIAARSNRNLDRLQAETIRVGLQHTFKTLWRPFLYTTSGRALVSKTARLYSKAFDQGQVTAPTDARPGRQEIVVSGWPESESHFALNGLAAGIEIILTLAGRQNVSVTYKSRPDGGIIIAAWST